MTRIGRWTLLGLLVAGCRVDGAVDVTAGPDTAGAVPDVIPGTVTRINDGDSLVIETGSAEIEVRLMGINAPESDECFGQEAEQRLVDLVEGQEVGLEDMGQDQFDRTLAYLWLGDLLVNLEQVGGGFAIATTPVEGDAQGEVSIVGASTVPDDAVDRLVPGGGEPGKEVLVPAPGGVPGSVNEHQRRSVRRFGGLPTEYLETGRHGGCVVDRG